MRSVGNILLSVVVALVIVLIPFKEAFAYLDPGTGSFIFQIIMAGILGALFTLKVFWKQVKQYCSRTFGRQNPSSGDGK